MWQIYVVLIIQVLLGVGVIALFQRMNQIKKQIDEITKEVKDYVSYIVEEDDKNDNQPALKWNDDERQSSLIQAVLGEIFP